MKFCINVLATATVVLSFASSALAEKKNLRGRKLEGAGAAVMNLHDRELKQKRKRQRRSDGPRDRGRMDGGSGSEDDTALDLNAALAIEPVSVSIEADQMAFQSYNDGSDGDGNNEEDVFTGMSSGALNTVLDGKDTIVDVLDTSQNFNNETINPQNNNSGAHTGVGDWVWGWLKTIENEVCDLLKSFGSGGGLHNETVYNISSNYGNLSALNFTNNTNTTFSTTDPPGRRLLIWLGLVSGPSSFNDYIPRSETLTFTGSDDAEHTIKQCAVPNDAPIWTYYDGLVDKNRNTVALAQSVAEYVPKHGLDDLEEEGEDEPSPGASKESVVPHRLVFTHQKNLLDCEVSSSVDSDPSLHTMAHNVRDTINAYKQVWSDDMQVVFLTDVDCRKALYGVEPELLQYYDGLEGMFKGDLCRAADLYLNGGYYFDVDLLVVHPFVPSPFNKFVTIKWAWYDNDHQFFQAFIVASPKNKIIRKSLRIMLEILKGERVKRGGGAMHMLGTQAMQDAWAELAEEDPSIVSHGRNKEVYLLSEHRIGLNQEQGYSKLPTQPNEGMPAFTDITCNFGVGDDDEEAIYFYSHIVGTENCGKPLHLFDSE